MGIAVFQLFHEHCCIPTISWALLYSNYFMGIAVQLFHGHCCIPTISWPLLYSNYFMGIAVFQLYHNAVQLQFYFLKSARLGMSRESVQRSAGECNIGVENHGQPVPTETGSYKNDHN